MESNPTTWADEFSNYDVSCQVRVGIDYYNLKLAASYEYTFHLMVKWWNWNGTAFDSTTEYRTVYLSYDPTADEEYVDLGVLEFPDAERVDVRVDSVLDDQGNLVSSVEPHVYVEAWALAERYYYFDEEDYLLDSEIDSTVLSDGFLRVSWDDLTGAEYYDLEWTFVDDYDGDGGSVPADELTHDFRYNSTRVGVSSTSYDIPLIYEQGYLLYRIRGVGKDSVSLQHWVPGEWSSANYSGNLVDDFDDKHRIEFTDAHEARLNWQYTASYAEEGKRKEVIGYFDGSLRNRQNVTRLNTDSVTIAGETIYDHQGRPAVSILPVPTGINELMYNRSFNVSNLTSSYYDRVDFDETYLTCRDTAAPLKNTSGAGKYYSSNASDTAGHQGYVPDAEGYAFTVTEFTPDNTGRIRRQSGVGPDHKFSSGHETKYYYGAPFQEQLDRLFGTEVGYAHHYKKVMVVDPNGQVSVTYTDLAGKTIATSLAGDTVAGMYALPSDTFDRELTVDLMKKSRKLQSLEVRYPLLVTSPGQFQFAYEMTPEEFEDACLDETFCVDCVYDLTISVKDECGTEMLPNGTVTQTIGEADGLCTSLSTVTIDEADLLIQNLAVGHYTVSKVLSLNAGAIEYYADHYVENNTCLRTLQDFIEEEIDSTDFSGCEVDYCKESCLDSLGPRPSGGAALTAWIDSLADCMFDCNMVSPCESAYEAMLADVSPSGQYAEYDVDTTTGAVSSSYKLSVLNESNQLKATWGLDQGSWSNPKTPYLDEFGNIDSVMIRSDGVMRRPEDLGSLAEFVRLWKPSWAKSLVQYHPEYCYYTWCSGNDGSNDYDYKLRTTDLYSEAYDAGLIVPIDSVADTPTLGSGYVEVYDPFFQPGGQGWYLRDVLRDTMNDYDGQSVGRSIWDYAVITVHCTDEEDGIPVNSCLLSHAFGTDSCKNDQVWQTFRAMYMALKLKLQEEARTAYAIENKCYNGCIGIADFDSTANEFNCYDKNIAPDCPSDANKYGGYQDTDNQPCSEGSDSLYANKRAVFPIANDIFGIDLWAVEALEDETTGTTITWANNAMDSICEMQCESMADYWMDALAGCDSFSTGAWEPGVANYDTARHYLIEVCKLGCDGTNPMGASTTPPGESTTPHGYTSFEEVLDSVLGASDTALCSQWLISIPQPYGHFYHGSNDTFPELDTCGCDLILDAHEVWDTLSNPPANVENFHEYFAYLNGFTVPLINDKVCICYDALFGEDNWSPESVTYLDSVSAWVPFTMTCPTCVSCDSVQRMVDSLTTWYDFDSFPDLYPVILTSFLNDTLGFNLGAHDYLSFLELCDSIAEGWYCDTFLTPEAYALEGFLNELADEGLLGPDTLDRLSIGAFLTSELNWSHQPDTCWRYEQWWGVMTDTLFSYLINTCLDDTCEIWLALDEGKTNFSRSSFINLRADHTYDTENNGVNHYFLFDMIIDDVLYSDMSGYISCHAIRHCRDTAYLCNEPVLTQVEVDTSDCEKYLLNLAVKNAEIRYTQYIDSVKSDFIANYKSFCLGNESEVFTLTFDEDEYHYTLYYYDRAGNLVSTVPPEGVRSIEDQSDLDHIEEYRDSMIIGTNIGRLTPDHELVTKYLYTSYNQVRWQNTPDGGTTEFWYDELGRIAVSQNSKQREVFDDSTRYSYTTYDALGRITKVGQIKADNDPTQSEIDDWENFPGNFAANEEQVTETTYDNALSGLSIATSQKNLRSRVASSTYDHDGDGTYDHGTHYSYDYHGNVLKLWQEFVDMADRGVGPSDGLFKMTYDYDLVSGNVNEVKYQNGYTDHFRHKYAYDADNRITNVQASLDNIIWSTHAIYDYYLNGPMSRTELGEHFVQGIDYAYTLHGWIKGVNSNGLTTALDIGKDGDAGDGFNGIDSFNLLVAKDAFSYSLHYYTGDYEPINNRDAKTTQYWLASQASSDFAAASIDLYNGNIPRMVTNIMDEAELVTGAQGTAYEYDVLSRIRTMEVHTGISGNAWGTGTSQTDYATEYTYDGNGNILTLRRDGDAGATYLAMDDMTYNYIGGTNQLEYVDDTVAFGNYTVDIDDQSSGNYEYDSIGNLAKDVAENIDTIKWTVYGKIDSIFRTSTSEASHLFFGYGSDGNRIRKQSVEEGTTDTIWTWYVRDAQGNVMATYTFNDGEDTLMLKEQHVYGSSRLGYVDRNNTPVLTDPGLDSFTRVLGCMSYELANHLGNMLAVVTDQKIPIDSDQNDTIDCFNPNVVAWQDYYPFGMLMPGRSGGEDYRFGFNGKEQDSEVSGTGNQYDYGFRIYNPRLGKFLSVDPLTSSYPWYTPYQFAGNKVLIAIDLDGLEEDNIVADLFVRTMTQGPLIEARKDIELLRENMNRHLGKVLFADPDLRTPQFLTPVEGVNLDRKDNLPIHKTLKNQVEFTGTVEIYYMHFTGRFFFLKASKEKTAVDEVQWFNPVYEWDRNKYEGRILLKSSKRHFAVLHISEISPEHFHKLKQAYQNAKQQAFCEALKDDPMLSEWYDIEQLYTGAQVFKQNNNYDAILRKKESERTEAEKKIIDEYESQLATYERRKEEFATKHDESDGN